MPKQTLAGVHVLVTRPAHQAEPLAQLIEAEGGVAVRFPTIEIAPARDPKPLQRIVSHLADFDLAIFISPNAVAQALPAIRAHGAPLPPIACIGQGSTRALERFGIRPAIAAADRFDSEALLAEPALTRVIGQRVAIFRGDGGRELLGNVLRKRGATVEYAECYRRVRPNTDVAPLLDCWAQGGIDVTSITSGTGLQNLCDMVGARGRTFLLQTPVVVVSQRQATACRELGFAHPAVVARTAADEAILEAITHWQTGQGGQQLPGSRNDS